MSRKKFFIPLLAVISSACGVGADDLPSPALPGTAPSPTGSPTPPLWVRLEEIRTCRILTCSATDGFAVDADGSYTVGSRLDVPRATGILDEGEIAQLDTLARAVASNDLTIPPNCLPIISAVGDSVTALSITLTDQNVYQVSVVDLPHGTDCRWGDPKAADALASYFETLIAKYDLQTARLAVSSSADMAAAAR